MTETKVAPEQARSQVETIRNSETFRNKESLRRLLAFLAERTLDGSAAGLKEYSLGIEVFGKPETYDPQSDPSVRVQVGKLRQKLEEYYLSEGRQDPVLVELPRRQFSLRFHAQEAPASGPEATAARRAARRLPWILAAVGVAAAVAGFLLGRQAAPPRGGNVASEVRSFWQPLLETSRPVVVCLGTPMFVRFEGARVRIGAIDDPAEIEKDPRVKQLQQLLESRTAQPSYIFTGVGEAHAAFVLSRLFTNLGREVSLLRNSALTWDEISTHNLVFLGSAKYNPQLRQLPVSQAFLVERGGVTNLKPAAGEPARFLRGYGEGDEREIVEDFAVVSRLPGIQGRGEIVILGASSTEGTWAAMQYATRAESLRELFAKVRSPSAEIPRHFEVLIRARFRDMVPVTSSYVTHRVYDPKLPRH